MARLPTWVVGAAVLLVLAEVHLISPAADLPAVTPAPRSPALEALALAPPGAVINLPVAADRAYLYEQVLHQQPLASGLNSGATRPALALLADLRRLRADELSPDELQASAQQRGVRYVVLHRDKLVAETFIPAITALRGLSEPQIQDELVEIWALW